MTTVIQDLASQFLLPLWQDKTLDVIELFVTPTTDIQTTLISGTGPDILKLDVTQIFNAFSSIKFSITSMTKKNNHSVYHWRISAIHTGNILNICPTGELITFSGIISGKMHKGRLIQYYCFSDLHRVLFESQRISANSKTIAVQNSEIDLLFQAIYKLTGKKLTKRETQCLNLWVKGVSLKSSARTLGNLSSRTIQTFRENIKRKLNISNYQQLLQLVYNHTPPQA